MPERTTREFASGTVAVNVDKALRMSMYEGSNVPAGEGFDFGSEIVICADELESSDGEEGSVCSLKTPYMQYNTGAPVAPAVGGKSNSRRK